MSIEGCAKHQSTDSRDDPCVFCLLEDIRLNATLGRKVKTLAESREIFERIYQASKNRLTQRLVFVKGDG